MWTLRLREVISATQGHAAAESEAGPEPGPGICPPGSLPLLGAPPRQRLLAPSSYGGGSLPKQWDSLPGEPWLGQCCRQHISGLENTFPTPGPGRGRLVPARLRPWGLHPPWGGGALGASLFPTPMRKAGAEGLPRDLGRMPDGCPSLSPSSCDGVWDACPLRPHPKASEEAAHICLLMEVPGRPRQN